MEAKNYVWSDGKFFKDRKIDNYYENLGVHNYHEVPLE